MVLSCVGGDQHSLELKRFACTTEGHSFLLGQIYPK